MMHDLYTFIMSLTLFKVFVCFFTYIFFGIIIVGICRWIEYDESKKVLDIDKEATEVSFLIIFNPLVCIYILTFIPRILLFLTNLITTGLVYLERKAPKKGKNNART